MLGALAVSRPWPHPQISQRLPDPHPTKTDTVFQGSAKYCKRAAYGFAESVEAEI